MQFKKGTHGIVGKSTIEETGRRARQEKRIEEYDKEGDDIEREIAKE